MMNILEAKTSLSKLVASVESGEVKEVIIARNGKPAARLVPLEVPKPVRLGLYEGQYKAPENFDDCNDEVLKLFGLSE